MRRYPTGRDCPVEEVTNRADMTRREPGGIRGNRDHEGNPGRNERQMFIPGMSIAWEMDELVPGSGNGVEIRVETSPGRSPRAARPALPGNHGNAMFPFLSIVKMTSWTKETLQAMLVGLSWQSIVMARHLAMNPSRE